MKCEVTRCRRTDVVMFMRRYICTRHFASWCLRREPNLKDENTFKIGKNWRTTWTFI